MDLSTAFLCDIASITQKIFPPLFPARGLSILLPEFPFRLVSVKEVVRLFPERLA